jgi:hypothetical protein
MVDDLQSSEEVRCDIEGRVNEKVGLEAEAKTETKTRLTQTHMFLAELDI